MGDAYSVVLCNEVMRAKLYLLKETEERKRQFSTSNFSLCTRQRDFFPPSTTKPKIFTTSVIYCRKCCWWVINYLYVLNASTCNSRRFVLELYCSTKPSVNLLLIAYNEKKKNTREGRKPSSVSRVLVCTICQVYYRPITGPFSLLLPMHNQSQKK